jgi:hypothetical protein
MRSELVPCGSVEYGVCGDDGVSVDLVGAVPDEDVGP